MTDRNAPEQVESAPRSEDTGAQTANERLSTTAQDLMRAELPPKTEPGTAPDFLEMGSAFEGKPPRERTSVADSAPRFSLDETDSPSTPRQWTMAISLTSTGSLLDENDQRRATGAENKLDDVLALAEQTRGVPVTLYVQSILPLERTEQPDGSIRSNRNDLRVATYRLEDGQATLVEEGPNEGFDRNLERLLERASARAGEGSMGLVIQSHGFATAGLGGDTGDATLDQLEQSIRNGLSASGRTALDLVNFDACSMGTVNVAQALQGEARHVVASSELERAFGSHVDGQNMTSTLSALLENPSMTAGEFANRSIELARQGANDDPGNLRADAAGTETLAAYDISRYPQFENALGNLGAALSTALSDPVQRQAIVESINSLPSFGNEGGATGSFRPIRRDARLFIDAIDQAVQQGRIADGDGRITAAIQGARDAVQNLVTAYHGENYNDYDRMGGISMFMPGSETLDVEAAARGASPLNMMQLFFDSDKGRRFEGRDDLASVLESQFGDLRSQLAPSADLERLGSAIGAVRASENPQEFSDALGRLQQTIREVDAGPIGQALVAAARPRLEQERDRMYQSELSRKPAEWQNFLYLFLQ